MTKQTRSLDKKPCLTTSLRAVRVKLTTEENTTGGTLLVSEAIVRACAAQALEIESRVNEGSMACTVT